MPLPKAAVERGALPGWTVAIDMTPDPLVPPAGFVRFRDLEGFIGLAGPYFWRALADGTVEYGFRAEARHGNPNGVLQIGRAHV